MRTLFEYLKEKIGYHAETIIAIPAGCVGLLLVSIGIRMITDTPLTVDIQQVAEYAIKGVGFLVAAGIGIAIKSRGFGDVDENTCDWKVLLIDSISLWIVLLLAMLVVFGATLWL